jgi:LPXTG-site transpeptidase (sortase) family protein
VKSKSFLLFAVVFILFGFFLYWVFTVFLPVATVELTYTAKKTAQAAFGTADLRTLLFPNFSISANGKSTYPDGGISIPALFIDEPIIFNVDPNNPDMYLAALKKGIAHAAGTKLPGYGGLGYYFAHSSSPALARQYNAVFYLLGKLRGGESVIVWYQGKKYDYTVTKTEITDPDDLSFLNESHYNKETIVLQTCWPPGTNSQRLLVFGERNDK